MNGPGPTAQVSSTGSTELIRTDEAVTLPAEAISWTASQELRARPRPTARRIYAIVLAASDDEIVEMLSETAMDAIEERNTLAELLSASLDLLHRHTAIIDRQRELIASLRRRLPDAREAAV